MDKYSVSELRAGVLIWQIASPFLIIFGTFANVLTIIVFSKPNFSRFTSTVYFLGLAVADLTFLYVGLVRNWVNYLYDIDIRSVHPVVCKVHMWLMYTCADTTVWILTAVTVERIIATLCPHKSEIICTKSCAKNVLAAIPISALFINSHLIYGLGKVEITANNTSLVIPCAPLTDGYGYFFEKIWAWINLCKFCIIPCIVLTAGNICIIYKLVSGHKKRRSQIVPSTSQGRADKNTRISVLLVGLNFLFIICTLPVCIYFIGEPYWIPEDVPRQIQLQDTWWAVVNVLMYINSSANFILYCSIGSGFRGAVIDLFKCRNNVRNSESNLIPLNTRPARPASI